MVINVLGRTSSPRRWTQAAKDCYERGCVCEGCFFNDFFSGYKCRMKASVIELVRLFGAPPKRVINYEKD